MQTITNLNGFTAQIVTGVSPKTNKEYMIFKIIDTNGKAIYSEFISDFYKQQYFNSIIAKGGNNNVS